MSDRHLVELYGLAVSAPIPLPGWPLAASTHPDVVVRFESHPADADAWDAAAEGTRIFRSEVEVGEEPNLVVDRFDHAQYLRLAYAEGIRFHIALDGSEVWADWSEPMTVADAVTFLLGPIMGVVLRQKRVMPLHASAVLLEGSAWAFVGPGGAGKSTLAAAFAADGAAVLTEDVLALRPAVDGGWRVSPGYAEIRLWDDAASLVTPAAATLPVLSPTWPKRGLDLHQHALPFARDQVPLGGLFILDEVLPESPLPARARLTVADGLIELVANAYVNYLAPPSALAAELQALSAVARTVPIWRLRPGAGRDGLARTVALVRALSREAGSTVERGDITK